MSKMKKIKFLSDIEVTGTMTVGEKNAEILTKDDLATPDWNQTDPAAPDFIKNKTHYETCTHKALSGKPSASKYIDIWTTGGGERLRFYTLAEDCTPDNFNFTAAKLNNYTIRLNEGGSYNEVVQAEGEELVFEKDLFRIANSEISDKYCVYEYRVNEWTWPNFAITILFVKEACQVSFSGYCSSDDKDLYAYISKPGIYIAAIDNFNYEVVGSYIELTGDIMGTTSEVTPLNWKYLPSDVASTDQLSNKAPKSHASSSTTYGVSTAYYYGHAKASSTIPKAPGTTAYIGSETSYFARGDHRHPLQTSVTGSAGSATKDSAGNIITDTYAKKTDLAGLASETYVQTYFNDHISPDGSIILNADWSQADPAASGFIKNRTHYDDEISTTFSGTPDSNGVKAGTCCSWETGNNGNLIKIAEYSETPLVFDKIIYTANFYGEEGIVSETHTIEQDAFSVRTFTDFTVYYKTFYGSQWYEGDTVLLINAKTAGFYETVIEEWCGSQLAWHNLYIAQPGVYITSSAEIVNLQTTSRILKTLDDKYIPDTFAKKTDLTGLASETYVENYFYEHTSSLPNSQNTHGIITEDLTAENALSEPVTLSSPQGYFTVSVVRVADTVLKDFESLSVTAVDQTVYTYTKDSVSVNSFYYAPPGASAFFIDTQSFDNDFYPNGSCIIISVSKAGQYWATVELYGGSWNELGFYAPLPGIYISDDSSIKLNNATYVKTLAEDFISADIARKTDLPKPASTVSLLKAPRLTGSTGSSVAYARADHIHPFTPIDWNILETTSSAYIKNKPFGKYLTTGYSYTTPDSSLPSTYIHGGGGCIGGTLVNLGTSTSLPGSFIYNGNTISMDACTVLEAYTSNIYIYLYDNAIIAIRDENSGYDSYIQWYSSELESIYPCDPNIWWDNRNSANSGLWLNTNIQFYLETTVEAIKTIEDQYIPETIARMESVNDTIAALQAQIDELKEQLAALQNNS